METVLSSISISGKIFLCGEYSVLFGGGALLSLTQKRFQWLLTESLTEDQKKIAKPMTSFHPESPLGKFFHNCTPTQQYDLSQYSFLDPFLGRGGFGASTAQFILLWSEVNKNKKSEENWKDILKDYFDIFKDADGVRPSGADLVAQSHGGGCIYYEPKKESCFSLNTPDYFKDVYVFSATQKPFRKVNTHEHLMVIERIPESSLKKLAILTEKAVEFINDRNTFLKALCEYVDELNDLKLVSKEALLDMSEFLKIEGVLFSKGCGALLSDTLIVFTSDSLKENVLLEKASELGLEFIQKGIAPQKGVQFE